MSAQDGQINLGAESCGRVLKKNGSRDGLFLRTLADGVTKDPDAVVQETA
jgi:hypothetical protein